MKDFELAKKYFYERKYELAKNLFLLSKSFYEAGLCCFLSSKFDDAKKYWEKEINSFDSSFGLISLDLIKGDKPKRRPTYFQIRAFFEVYASLLIENSMFNEADKFLNSYQYLAQFNPEIFKFCARVLFAYGYYDSSKIFLDKAHDLYFKDPEALFISAQIYFDDKEYEKSIAMLTETLEIVPTYFPALELQKKIDALKK